MDRIVDLVLDESQWMPAAMALSAFAVVALAQWQRRRQRSREAAILQGMQLFYGCMVGIMASGHLLAVTVKLALGILEGSPWLLYPLGIALAAPAWWLAWRAMQTAGSAPGQQDRQAVALNAGLGLFLLALGLHNAPLAFPAALNIAYRYHKRPAVGWAIVAVAVAAMLGLFVGSLVFMASGQSFEDFKGME